MISLFSRIFGKRIEIHDRHRSPFPSRDQESSAELERVVRIAVYDSLGTVPRIVDIRSDNYTELLNEVSSKTYAFAHDKGGTVPYIAIKEIVENLLHADIQEAVITILPDGNTIRVSDQGPGIPDKEKAFLPGFTTASSKMKETVRGVGSGLPIVKDSMRSIGGFISIEDNLKKGCVITLSCSTESAKSHLAPKEQFTTASVSSSQHSMMQRAPGAIDKSQPADEKSANMVESEPGTTIPVEKLHRILSQRQQKVFMILAEEGEGGPSLVAKELEISLSTAYRDLVALEEYGLIQTIDTSGKRKLTSKGIAFLPYITG
ncbi:MAG TPA: ATP-binding protein [Bacillota bacterium]|nr:ATP-binding protein [Bacillota bacterium]